MTDAFRRIDHPEPTDGGGGSAYEVLRDGRVVGQVWQITIRPWSFAGWKRGGQPGRRRLAWVNSASGDDGTYDTRKDAAAWLPNTHQGDT